MLGGEPLTDDISIRDYNGGIGCHVASVLEETLLLPKDMVEQWGLRRNEVFLQAKRFLGMVCIFTPLVSFFFLFFYFSVTLISCYLYIYIYFFVCACFFFLKKGCSEHLQNGGDIPFRLTAAGWWKKKKGCCCVDTNHCWKQQCWSQAKIKGGGTGQEERWIGLKRRWDPGREPKKTGQRD